MSTVTYNQVAHKGTKAASPIYTMKGDLLGSSVWADGIDWSGYQIDGADITTLGVLERVAAGGEQEVTISDTPAGIAPDVEYVTKAQLNTALQNIAPKAILDTANNFTVKINKEYYLGTIDNNILILSEDGLAQDEVAHWHFYFTAGANPPKWQAVINWASTPEFKTGNLCEVDIQKIKLSETQIVYTGYESERTLS